MSIPGPEHRRLGVFIGTWQTDGELKTGERGTNTAIHSRDVYEWLPGEFFVVHRWDSDVGGSEVHGLEIIGYDAEAGTYRTQFFDNGGGSGSERLTVEGDTWTWTGRNVAGADWHRCRSTVGADGKTMVARHEQSKDGVNWSPWMDVTLRKQEG